MRIGWRRFIKHKLFRPASDYSVGIALAADAVTFCAVKKQQNTLIFIDEKTVAHDQWERQLDAWMHALKLPVCNCNLAFSVDWHHIVQTDRPNVEDHEVHDALAWSIRDLLGDDKEYVYDYTDLPVPLAGTRKVNVFALPREHVDAVGSALLETSCRLMQISVAEMALCNLLEPNTEAVLTLTQESGEEVVLNVVREGTLYFSRRLKGFENIGSFSEEELNMGLIDSLSVQVQRTLDYFESQLRQPPIRRALVRLDTQHNALITRLIKQVVPVTVDVLHPVVQLPDNSNVNMISLGAAIEVLSPPISETQGQRV